MSLGTRSLVVPFMNFLIFLGLGLYTARRTRTAQSTTNRMLWQLALLPIFAVILGECSALPFKRSGLAG